MSDEDAFYTKALREIETNSRDEPTWARALAQSNGNKDAAVSAYIRLRVAQQQQCVRRERAEDRVAERYYSYSQSGCLLLGGGIAISIVSLRMIWELFTSESPPGIIFVLLWCGLGFWALRSYFRGRAYARGLAKFK